MQLAAFYPHLYRILKPAFPSCLWSGNGKIREIALTFDDGPHPQYTPQLLKVLDRYQIRASFFWLGVGVERSPRIAKQVYQRGHGIGLHGYTHQAFIQLSKSALQKNLELTQQAIATACDLPPQTCQQQIRNVRPPFGIFTPKILEWLHQWHYRPVMWSVVPEDWVERRVEIVVRRVLSQVENGSSIVLHDGELGGENVAIATAQIIPQLQRQGYEFVTVDRLWQLSQ